MSKATNTTETNTLHFRKSPVLNDCRIDDYNGLPVAGYCEKKCINCDVSTKKVSYN